MGGNLFERVICVSGKRKAVVTKTKKYNKNLAILYKNSLAR